MRNSNQLSAAFVRAVPGHGVYSDGNGLTLRVDKWGKLWVQRVSINGKRHNMGLSSYRLVSLAEARDNALANAQTIRHGRNPVLEQHQAREESRRLDKPTFAVAAEKMINLKRPTWRNAKHSAQWSSTLTTYAFPIYRKQTRG